MSDAQRTFYVCFVLVLVACFTPFKMVAYMLPAIVVVALLSRRALSTNRLFAVAVTVLFAGILYDLLLKEFLVTNYLVAVGTYSAFLPIAVLESRTVASRELLVKMLTAASTMVFVQGIVGLVQAFNGALHTHSFGGANGDYVAGTIYPYLHAELAFSNPMFAVNMTMMLLACLYVPGVFTGKRRPALFVGAAALVLASVMHVLIFLVAAGLFAMFFIGAKSAADARLRRRLLGLLVLVCALAYVAMPGNVANIEYVAKSAVDLEAVTIPRTVLVSRVLTDLPDDEPAQPYVGLGPGQFSSRASLIMSGLYLGRPGNPKTIPLLEPQTTRLAANYCISLLTAQQDRLEDDVAVGSSQQPFFSLLSLYTETGLIGLVLVLVVLARLLLQVRRRAHEEPALRFQAMLFCTGTVFMFLLGVQDNYWETPQAILVGLLLLKVMHANILHAPVPSEA